MSAKITNQDSLFAYWQEKKGDRLAPTRKDMDPVDFPRIWTNSMMYKVIHPTNPEDELDFQVTRMGGFLVEMWEQDQTGLYFDDIFVNPYKDTTREVFETVVKTGKPSIVEMDAGWMNKDYVKYKRLTLPLSDDGETVNRLFLHLVFDDRG